MKSNYLFVIFAIAVFSLFSSSEAFAKSSNKKDKSVTQELRIGAYNTGADEFDTLPVVSYSMNSAGENSINRLNIDLSMFGADGSAGVYSWSGDVVLYMVDYSFLYKINGTADTGFYTGPGIGLSYGTWSSGTKSCYGTNYTCTQDGLDAFNPPTPDAAKVNLSLRISAGYNLTKNINIESGYLFNKGLDNGLYLGAGYKW